MFDSLTQHKISKSKCQQLRLPFFGLFSIRNTSFIHLAAVKGKGKGKGKGKVFPYSLPSVGPGADPGVQAVSPQVT